MILKYMNHFLYRYIESVYNSVSVVIVYDIYIYID